MKDLEKNDINHQEKGSKMNSNKSIFVVIAMALTLAFSAGFNYAGATVMSFSEPVHRNPVGADDFFDDFTFMVDDLSEPVHRNPIGADDLSEMMLSKGAGKKIDDAPKPHKPHKLMNDSA